MKMRVYEGITAVQASMPLSRIEHGCRLVGKPQTGRLRDCMTAGRALDAKGRESVGWGCAAVLKGRHGKKEQVIPGETKA